VVVSAHGSFPRVGSDVGVEEVRTTPFVASGGKGAAEEKAPGGTGSLIQLSCQYVSVAIEVRRLAAVSSNFFSDTRFAQ